MLRSTDSFVDALEKWVAAMRDNDLEAAGFFAERMQVHGERLATHPRFRRSFQQHWPALEPSQALDYLTRFLICATEIRAEAIKDTRPV